MALAYEMWGLAPVTMDNRLKTALLVSMMVHLMLLALGRTPPPLPDVPAMQLVLKKAEAQPQVKPVQRFHPPATKAETKPAPPKSAPVATAMPNTREMAPPVLHSPVTSPEPVAALRTSPAVVSAASPATVAVSVPTAVVEDKKAGKSIGSAAGLPELDPGSVVRYRLALKDFMRKHKSYPVLARERGWEGEVELRLSFQRDVPGGRAHIIRSSRYAMLDNQALSMVQAAMVDAPLPANLRGTDFSLTLTVDFSLEDE